MPENLCFSGTNQKPERRWPFGTGLVRHCPQGLFSPFFTFLRALFSRPFRLSLALTICPWVSEDVMTYTLTITFFLKSWYFSCFSLSVFAFNVVVARYRIIRTLLLLSWTVMSGLRWFSSWSVCMVKSHNIFISSFSVIPTGLCSYTCCRYLSPCIDAFGAEAYPVYFFIFHEKKMDD